ncbi:uncharacterized protein LOC126784177 [Argentina anserina]|uniref:uncharacterized protein LOC126784177 n=1 Tax=Argentina anserina TaxID=57926 RepID=UPI0021766FAB|nr:uncharacterized protein LOC126784177 [Potentilla anserina]
MKPIASLIFLATLCLLQHVALGGQPVGGNVLEQACQFAKNKETCINTLKKDPNSQGADLTGLALIALRLAAANAAEVESHLRTLLQKNAPMSPEIQQGVSDCAETYSDANGQLDDSTAALSEKNFNDIITWVKIAVADSEYCQNAVKGQPTVVADKSKVFLELCDNALSVIKALAPNP